jgi:hypothetical protein
LGSCSQATCLPLQSAQLLGEAFPLPRTLSGQNSITERRKSKRATDPCARLGLGKKRKVLESLVFAAFPS